MVARSRPQSPLARYRRPFMWGAIAVLLALPAIAMQFTHEVAWGSEDFAFAALLLVGAGLIYELAVWKLLTARARWVAGAVIVLAVLGIWADAAVGVF